MSPSPSSSMLRCTRCDEPLPPGYKPGLCPVCLMDMAMRPTHDDTLPVAPPQKLLTPEDLQPHFPLLEILECIGRGGMGVVYKARQKALGRLVALKLLVPEQKKDAAFAERFAHEARALAALNHPNIVTVYDFGESGGFYYLLMEYVDGVNLRQAMRGSHLSPEQALAIVPPICEALQYAHEHGIVHRDIKPENLLMDKAGRVKIADFGIAKMLSHETASADANAPAESPRGTVVAGTPQYMAPEQSNTAARADHRVDIYSLGVVLYELLTGELPAGKLQLPPQGAMTDTRLDAIVRRALEQDPEQRYQTVRELQTHLATLSAAPVETKVYSREQYQRWFATVLRVAGWLCAGYGLLRLLRPFFSHVWRPPQPEPTFFDTLLKGLPEALMSFFIAWILIRHVRLFIGLSYRPLLIPPRMGAEIVGVLVRLAALALLAFGGIQLEDYAGSASAYRHDYLIQGILMLVLGLFVFHFEHTLVPIIHAVPVWKPLPYAEESTARRGLAGHAIGGGLIMGFLLYGLYMLIQHLSEDWPWGAGWEAEYVALLLSRLLAGAFVAGVASLLGWTAVVLIRRSGGRLYGLGLASAAAAALPLYVIFVVLSSVLYGVAESRSVGQEYLPDGSSHTVMPNRPAILLWVTTLVAGMCAACWLVFWRRLRARPAPVVSPLGMAPQGSGWRMAVFISAVGACVLCVAGIQMYGRRSPAPLRIPDEQFARHVERGINVRLHLLGLRHDMRQGTLTLPPVGASAQLTLPGLRDPHDNPLKGGYTLLRTGTGILLTGENVLSKSRMSVDQTSFKATRREVVVPLPPQGSDMLHLLFRDSVKPAPASIRARLLAGASLKNFEALYRGPLELIVQPQADGSIKIFGVGVALVTADFPSRRNWLELDDQKVAAAFSEAYRMNKAGKKFVVVHERSPSVVVFVNDWRAGLLENLGPSEPGARDVRLRVQLLPDWPG